MEQFLEAIQNAIEVEHEFGVQLVPITGKVLAEDPTYVEVLINGKSVYAKPCMPFGAYVVPNAQWLSENSAKVAAYVAFEKGNPAHPVYLGITYLDNVSMPTDYPNIAKYGSSDFEISMNDSQDELAIEALKLGHSIKMSSDGITLTNSSGFVIKMDSSSITIANQTATDGPVLSVPLINILTTLLQTLSSVPVPPNTPALNAGTATSLINQLNTIKSSNIKIN
jgi:hypothetical protein